MTDARLILPLLFVGFLGSTSAGGPEAVEALLGFDPVLLTEGKEVLGNEEISLTREGIRYHFANARTKSTFMGDPERYDIQMGGLCARLGESVPGSTHQDDFHDSLPPSSRTRNGNFQLQIDCDHHRRERRLRGSSN